VFLPLYRFKTMINTKIKDEYQSAQKTTSKVPGLIEYKKQELLEYPESSKAKETVKEEPVIKSPTGQRDDGGNELILREEADDYLPPNLLVKRQAPKVPKPQWHAPWKLMRVISGHIGWVRCIDIDSSNEWFATGSNDRTVKIWDLASGTLKLSLTGHISAVRGIQISDRHPYLFSCGEDKMVKCWDLEHNMVVRQYHGHLSGVYSMALHPTLDVLITSSRDSTARVWDMRTKHCVHVLTGHKSTIACVKAQEHDPQIITGSMDSTVRLWDLAAGKTLTTLTHHKKSVRALTLHPTE
jgi:pleiotropic regulator 1